MAERSVATVDIDDDELERAQELTGIVDVSVLVEEALRALIDRETRRRQERLAKGAS